MPVLAGWLTGEQVPEEIIEQTLLAMSEVLGRHGGQPARTVQPGAGLVAFSDTAYAMSRNDSPPVLDWVPDRRTLVYRRPLSGLHTLYYCENWPAEGNLLFASEIKALLAVGAPRRLHLAALDALLRYGFMPAPWTIFKDISCVPAGSILRWQRAKLVVNHATDYRFDESPAPPDALDQLHDQLVEVSAGQLPPHEHVVALSGGGPASALATVLAAQQSTTRFTLAALDYTNSTGEQVWQDAQQIAEACELPLLAITGVDQVDFWTATLAALEAPCVDTRPLALHQLLHTAAVETGARVALSGLGGTVIQGPIPIAPESQSAAGTGQVPLLESYQQWLGSQPGTGTSSLFSQEVAASLREAEPWEETLHARKLARRAAQFADPTRGSYYLDLHLRLPDLIVNTVQQLATQERMAVRSPYLHHQIMDTFVGLPPMLSNGLAKERLLTTLLQRHLPQMAGNTIPLYAPVSSLLRIADSDLLEQVLSPAAIKARGIFDAQEVARLQQQAEGKSVSRELLLVFTTQLLCHLFEVE